MTQKNEKAVIFTNVKKQYPVNFELNISDLTLMTNSLYCLQGVNGSGKSTLLNMLLDIILPDTGRIMIHGFKHNSDNAKKLCCSFLNKDRLLDFLTVKEYFYLVGNSYRLNKNEINKNYDEINSFFERPYFNENKLIKDYSGGNQQLIGLMIPFITKSKLIVLDEPFNFLDSKTSESLSSYINKYIKENNPTILFTSNTNNFFNLENINFIDIENGLTKIRGCQDE